MPGLVMIVISVSYATTWIYLAAHQEAPGARRRVHSRRLSAFRFTAGNGGYLAGTAIAFVSPIAALIMFGLLAAYYLFEHLPTPAGEPAPGLTPDGESRAVQAGGRQRATRSER